jgi:hypothetical protein
MNAGFVEASALGIFSWWNVLLLAIGAVAGIAIYMFFLRPEPATDSQPALPHPSHGSGDQYQAKDLLVIHQLRRDKRIPVVHPVSIGAPDGTYTATSRDISAGGMSMTTNANLKVAQPIQLSFSLPEQHITVPAVVWWRKGNVIGVRFDVTDERRLWISKWVEEQAVEPAT